MVAAVLVMISKPVCVSISLAAGLSGGREGESVSVCVCLRLHLRRLLTHRSIERGIQHHFQVLTRCLYIFRVACGT